jgi:hypothetical protein
MNSFTEVVNTKNIDILYLFTPKEIPKWVLDAHDHSFVSDGDFVFNNEQVNTSQEIKAL